MKSYSPGVTIDEARLLTILKWWGGSLLVCVLLFGVDMLGRFQWLRGGVERGLLVIDQQVAAGSQRVFRPFTWLLQANDQKRRLADLENRLAQAAVDQVKVKTLEARVSSLESLSLKTAVKPAAQSVVGLIDYGDRIGLAAGSYQGIRQGQVVTDANGVLLGRVKRVGYYASELELVTDPGSRITVTVENTGTKGMVEGRGTQAEFIGALQTEPLSEQDIVVTSGSDGLYPPGLVIGQVTKLIGKPEDVTKGALVEPLAKKSGLVAVW